jgi:tricorn protease
MTNGYPRFPAIRDDAIVFTAEDDLWRVPTGGGVARRLTAGVSAARSPRFSPDGRRIAYIGAEEGPDDVYVVPADGGQSRRLTFEGATWCRVAGWSPDGESVIYASNARSAHQTDIRLRQVGVGGGKSVELPFGRATAIARGPRGVTVLAREYFNDLAYWKRYRGGTAGQLWIDSDGAGRFRRLTDLAGNLERPEIVGERVYFLSDHEGHGNVYSLDLDGGDLRRHTDHDDFYARGLAGDGARLVYHCGGELYLVDPAGDAPRRLNVQIGLTRTQRSRRFVDPAAYLDSVDVAPDGAALAVTTRGKAFSFAGWEGPVAQHGQADGVRYRLLTWLPGGDRLLAAAADTGPAEVLVTFRADGTHPPVRLDHLDVGRASEIKGSPAQPRAAVANHRGELLLVDLDGDVAAASVLDSTDHGEISDLAFSPDGKWIAYARPEGSVNEETAARSAIMLAEVDGGRVVCAAERVLSDSGPAFDPEGKYLYFIGSREFKPVYDGLHFDLGFPGGARPYAVALAADTPPAFLPQPKGMHEAAPDEAAMAGKPDAADSDQPPAVKVDVAGLARRVAPVPVDAGRYVRVMGIPGKLVVLSEPAVEGVMAHHDAPADPVGRLDTVDLATGKVERIAEKVSHAAVTPDGKTLLYRSGSRLRLVPSGKKVPETDDNNRESGWIDLGRVKVSVRPEAEWPQMFRETWRLLGEQFWVEDMSGVDWGAVYARYAPLVERVSTRGELSDLMWELTGELGTSHAYERDGDYRPGPQYGQGYLGAEFDVGPDGTCSVAKIHLGDSWDPAATSPLNRPGVDVRAGDVILAVNGQPVEAENSLAQRLVNQADQEISLTVHRAGAAPRRVVVRALASELPLRYREWVTSNRRAVHEATGGRVGYLHIPDMSPHGYAEFHRGFLNEYDREGLIVDVRFNGGGHVSALLLEKLARRRTGHVYARWVRPVAFPNESPRGPMVALTNELAGSDGDIFSHGFKQMGLGPLVGTRTWGGVIGYYGWRPRLADGTFVSQPEISFHFDDVKWGVENYGVDPDVEIDYPPQDYAAGVDPQLDKAIEVVLEEMEKRPPHRVEFAERPKLTPPSLPPRPQAR